ncbi:Di-copper centre-containing protein [Aulographum hederae CBS 113979]|uniref:tyrosinase n=1 Tax=Aulographum hederae CBS 113979 TaxID=1176131 RepID=A0A6G1GRW5_9PEZI|nr:Di-copper centre-containing protein [Aulographum hederae CBS 113979]
MRFASYISATASIRWLLVIITLSSSASASPVESRSPDDGRDSLLEAKRSLEKRASIPVTGAKSGGIQPRLEIRQLMRNADQWNMYLLGLDRMQKMPQNDQFSYYQIAGIHGVPNIPWDGVTATGDGVGYCTHSSNLFCSWHRPYMALYEQILVANAIDAAYSFPQGTLQDRYLSAARNLRMPYYDWAISPAQNQPAYPNIFSQTQVVVTNGTASVTMDNPLHLFKFTDMSQLIWSPYLQWNITYRHPTSMTPSAKSQDNNAANEMNAFQEQAQDSIFRLLTQPMSMGNFSNSAWARANNIGGWSNIESLHDNVHNMIGGGNYGHMSILAVSAFDPLFWLHHCMVDRAYALYQALNPNEWIEPMAQPQSSFWYNTGFMADANTQLKPFHSSASGEFWTSNTARYTETFGYTYPELQNGNLSALRAAINSLYGPNPSVVAANPAVRRDTTRVKPSDDASSFSSASSELTFFGPWTHKRPSGDVSTSSSSSSSRQGGANYNNGTETTLDRDYMINTRMLKGALDQSYTIFFFLGDFTADPAGWATEASMVGMKGVLGSSTNSGMPGVGEGDGNGNGGKARDGGRGWNGNRANGRTTVDVVGAIPLTRKLLRRYAQGMLMGLGDETVVGYLKRELHWRVRGADGKEIPRDKLPGLKISVASIKVEPATSVDTFPLWTGKWTVHTDITDGRPGGYGKGEPY